MKALTKFFFTGLLLVVLSSQPCSAGDRDQASRLQFEEQVQPVLRELCSRCHGPEKQKAQLRLDTLSIDLVNSGAGEHWEEVLNQLNVGEMPPEDELQPTPAQREAITSWIHGELEHAAETRRASGDGSSLRRMTGYEYSNTMRDLLGIDLDFAKDLPPEGAAEEGFKNNNYVLGTSSIHLAENQPARKRTLVDEIHVQGDLSLHHLHGHRAGTQGIGTVRRIGVRTVGGKLTTEHL